MTEDDELSQLEELLRADLAQEETPKLSSSGALVETNLFSSPSNNHKDDSYEKSFPSCKKGDASELLHTGDTDSSDDEEKRNFLERKYSDYGTNIKKLLDHKEKDDQDRRVEFESRLRDANLDLKLEKVSFRKNVINDKNVLCAPEISRFKKESSDVYTDPVFGIRIVKPLLSSSVLLERMQGREAISLLRVKRHTEHGDLSKDWVLGGVIVRKSNPKQSQKGSQFIIWTLSDLKDDLKTVTMFLFSKAYKSLWKTPMGTAIAVLNPNVLDRSQDRTEQACLSIDAPDRVMIIGQSKDFGVCKSRKKNGDPCTSFVNISQCEHCVYHVQQEHKKYSKRQELQSSTMGKGLSSLQNKVFGKNTYIYGGKEFSSAPISNTRKVKEQDKNRLMSLSEYHRVENNYMINKAPVGAGPLKKNAATMGVSGSQRVKDLERLEKLSDTTLFPVPSPAVTNTTFAERVASSKFGLKSPSITFSLSGSGTIDLNVSYGQKAAQRAKINAIKLVKEQGGLHREDPNNIKGTEAGKKRALKLLSEDCSDTENKTKKTKFQNKETANLTGIKSERFKKILEATSSHQNLVSEYEDQEQEKYFSKLEKKEALEEKMLNTYKLACKAVRCIKCKYTSFSASQKCKDEHHPLKVFDSYKRFFKCLDCGNRTISLEIIPLHSCKNCSSSRWEKAPMMRENKVCLGDGLSIRGEEETYIGGQVTTGKNINLLVPDS